MQKKQAMKMQELEFDRMWHELGMKECDALAARMEIDAIERYRRDMECKQHTDMILQQRERQRQIDRENLKREQLAMKEKYEADMRKEAEEEAARLAKRIETGEERKQAIADRDALLAKQAENERITENVWKSLAGQGMADDQAKIDLMKRKEKELDECNKKMAELRIEIEKKLYDDELMDAAVREQQKAFDKKKCEDIRKADEASKEAQKNFLDQIADREKEREEVKKRLAIEDEYFKQLHNQLQQLIDNKNAEDEKHNKMHQQDVLKQIQYNKTLRMRELQEELDQRRKAVQAAKEYEEEMAEMLCRASFSDQTHPFMAQMNKLKDMRPVCPCSKPTWCKKCKK
ncbi:hypothetical protein NE865_03344 [Phthorimaea operculella]|nr:hypothetical protein NE865_03344 [Phthorimaea operculella]